MHCILSLFICAAPYIPFPAGPLGAPQRPSLLLLQLHLDASLCFCIQLCSFSPRETPHVYTDVNVLLNKLTRIEDM